MPSGYEGNQAETNLSALTQKSIARTKRFFKKPHMNWIFAGHNTQDRWKQSRACELRGKLASHRQSPKAKGLSSVLTHQFRNSGEKCVFPSPAAFACITYSGSAAVMGHPSCATITCHQTPCQRNKEHLTQQHWSVLVGIQKGLNLPVPT